MICSSAVGDGDERARADSWLSAAAAALRAAADAPAFADADEAILLRRAGAAYTAAQAGLHPVGLPLDRGEPA